MRRLSRLLRLTAGAVVTIALAGCPAAHDAYPGNSCKSDEDCFAGEHCMNGSICVPNEAMPDIAVPLPIVDMAEPIMTNGDQ
jgi:hypothetical protein